MNANDFLPPLPYLTPKDMPGDGTDLVLIVQSVEAAEFRDDKTGQVNPYLKMYFEGEEKYFKVGKKANKTLQAMYGDDTDDWIGKRVVLTEDEWSNNGVDTPYLKVKKLNFTQNGRTPKPRPAPEVTPNDDAAEDGLPF